MLRFARDDDKKDEDGQDVMDVDRLLAVGRVMDARPLLSQVSIGAWLKVRNREGLLIPLEANAAQKAFESARGKQNIVLKARQMGLSTWIAARFFLKTITHRGVLTVQVAHTREAAEGLFGMVERFWQNLPEVDRRGALRRSRANAGQMRFPELDSEFRVMSAGDENAGRGLTIQNLHCSEVARWPGDAGATLAGLRAALAVDGEMVLESTANGAYGAFYEEWMRAEGSGLVRHFFPWWMEKAYVGPRVDAGSLTERESELVRREGLTLEQVGFRRMLEERYRGMAWQEFAEDAQSCFRASGECVFDVDAIEGRRRELPEVVECRRNGCLLVWLPPVIGRKYVVAVDTAGGGSGGDFAAVQVIDEQTGLQCAELQQRLSVLETARVGAAIAREYNDALLVVERNNHGAGVLAYLDSAERYGNVYAQGGQAGWLTSVVSRPAMIGRLGALIVESPWLFASDRLLAECRTFVAGRDGVSRAVSGGHDDLVMAMAVAQGVRAELMQRRGGS